MPPSDQEVARIAAAAEQFMTQTSEELETAFSVSWARSRDGSSLPHRGGLDFWRNAQHRLAREIAENSTAGSISMGMIADSVLHWAESSGIDLTRFEGPISIFVALVAKSVFDELRSRTGVEAETLDGESKRK
jgi:hypothetical protein